MENGKREIISVVQALIVGLAGSFALLAAGNFLALRSADPDQLLTQLAYIALTAGAVICGVAQTQGRGGWKLPAITGGAFALLLFVISLIAGGSEGLLMRAVVYLIEGAIVLLTAHFTPIGTKRYAGRGKKAAYRYLERK